MKKVFVICPVRNADEETKRKLEEYVRDLEEKGHKVHCPPRDTDQNDPCGTNICRTNHRAILEADEIHIWYTEQSSGSFFDLGGLFMLMEVLGIEKQVVILNDGELIDIQGKSFIKVLRALAQKPASKNAPE